MSRFDFTLSALVTVRNTPTVTDRPTSWHGVDDKAVAAMMLASDDAVKTLRAGAGKGGHIRVEVTREVIAITGGGVPIRKVGEDPTNGTVSVDGLNNAGLAAFRAKWRGMLEGFDKAASVPDEPVPAVLLAGGTKPLFPPGSTHPSVTKAGLGQAPMKPLFPPK